MGERVRPIRREAVARAARERSEQEREWHRGPAMESHLLAVALNGWVTYD